MSALEDVACDLCGSTKRLLRYDRPYVMGSLSDAAVFAATTDEFTGYGRVVACGDCGLVYTSPRPKAAELSRGYADSTDQAYLAESSSRAINAHLSMNTIKTCVSSGKMLEVGAAVGYFLNAARSEFDVVGLELSRWAREHAEKRFGLKFLPEPLEQAKLEAASFDAVAMIDVIEHLPSPKAAVAAAARVLKKGGILYLVTPDIGSLSSKILRSYWWGLRPAHIYYFDEWTLRRLLKEQGFEVVVCKSFGRIFSYGYWLSRLRHYPAWFYNAVKFFVDGLGLQHKLVYIDTRDSIEICARKL